MNYQIKIKKIFIWKQYLIKLDKTIGDPLTICHFYAHICSSIWLRIMIWSENVEQWYNWALTYSRRIYGDRNNYFRHDVIWIFFNLILFQDKFAESAMIIYHWKALTQFPKVCNVAMIYNRKAYYISVKR